MRTADLRRAAALSLACALSAAGCSDGTGPRNPVELAFVTGPLSLSRADVLAPVVAVAVRDGRGNSVDWSGEISLTLEGGATGGALGGTTRRTARGGIAIFDDLQISSAGAGYWLVARSATLNEAVSEPFDVHAVFEAATVTAGRWHTCALTADGAAYCWGAGGLLGTGDNADRWVPTRVQTQVRFASIDTHWTHTCALSQAAEVYCWGSNAGGELGDGTMVARTIPTRVDLPGPAVSVSAGYISSCAVLADGRGYCWGWGGWGALGIGQVGGPHATPVLVPGDHQWARIDAGYFHTCGLTTAGEAYCWGDNRYGATGVGVSALDGPGYGVTWTPTQVRGGHQFADVVTGGGVCAGGTCGITTDGRVLCWGRHYQTGGNTRYVSEPRPVNWGAPIVQVTVGSTMVCGITGDGSVHCAGPATAYAPLDPELRVASFTQGEGHACFTTTAGATFCWGSNVSGRLGSGTDSPGWFVSRGVWAPSGG
jgi:alpha-tubulin suppressor-like RCC1 family protein